MHNLQIKKKNWSISIISKEEMKIFFSSSFEKNRYKIAFILTLNLSKSKTVNI